MCPILNWLVYYSTQFSICLRPEALRLAAQELVQQVASGSFTMACRSRMSPAIGFSGNTLFEMTKLVSGHVKK